MAVCRKCGYRNTPDTILKCNFCHTIFEKQPINKYLGVPLADILTKYGHNVVSMGEADSTDIISYVELDRGTFKTYKDDFSIELVEIQKQLGLILIGIDFNNKQNIAIWFKKIT